MSPALFVAGFLSAVLLGAIAALALIRSQIRVDAALAQQALLAILQSRLPGVRSTELGPLNPEEGVCTLVIDGRVVSLDTDGRVVTTWSAAGNFPWDTIEGRSGAFFDHRGLGLHRLTGDLAFDDHYGVIPGEGGDVALPERLRQVLGEAVELAPIVTDNRVQVGPVEGSRPDLLAAMSAPGRLRRRLRALLGDRAATSAATVEAMQHGDQGLRFLGARAARVIFLARELERSAARGWSDEDSSVLRRRR